MEIKIYDTKKKQFVWVKASGKVIEALKNRMQGVETFDYEKVVKKDNKLKIINSNDYKKFIGGLQPNIKNIFCKMSNMEKKVMFLKFFKDMSFGSIAEELDCVKGTVQCYFKRGCTKFKKYLDDEFAMQENYI